MLLQSNILVKLKLYLCHVHGLPTCSDILDVRHGWMLLSFKNGVDFLQRFSFCFYPIVILAKLASYSLLSFTIEKVLTIKKNVIISHDPLIMYVFHVIFCSAMGMTKVRSKLKQNISFVSHCEDPRVLTLTHSKRILIMPIRWLGWDSSWPLADKEATGVSRRWSKFPERGTSQRHHHRPSSERRHPGCLDKSWSGRQWWKGRRWGGLVKAVQWVFDPILPLGESLQMHKRDKRHWGQHSVEIVSWSSLPRHEAAFLQLWVVDSGPWCPPCQVRFRDSRKQ